MGDFFDTMTIVVVIIMVFLVLVIAIHASARLVQMTFGRKSGLKQKDTAKSNWQKTLTNAFIPSVHRKTLVVG